MVYIICGRATNCIVVDSKDGDCKSTSCGIFEDTATLVEGFFVKWP